MLLLAQKQMNNHLIYRYFVRARCFSTAPPATNSDKRRNVQGNNTSATTPHTSKVNFKRLSPTQQGAAPVVRSRPNFTEDFKSSIASPALAWSQGSTQHSIKQAAQHNQNRTSQRPNNTNQPDRFKSSNRYQQLDDDALQLDAKLLAQLTAQLPVPREMALERLEAQRAYNRMFTSPAKVAAQISTTNNTSSSAPSSGDGPQAVSAKLTWPELHRLIANIQQHPQTSARRASLSKLLKDLHRVRALFSMREHVWKLIHSPNFSHAPSVVEFSIMLHSYAQERLPQKAKALFEDMLAAGLRPDKVAYGTMMNCYAKCGMLQEAEATMQQCMSAGQGAQIRHYNTLMHAAIQCIDIPRALHHFRALVDSKLGISSSSFGLLQLAYSQVGDIAGVQAVQDMMNKLAVPVHSDMYTFGIKALIEHDKQNVDAPLAIFQKWRQSDENIPVTTFSLMVWLLVENNRIDEALEVLEDACSRLASGRLKDAEIFAAPKPIKTASSSEEAYEDSPDEFDMDRALLGEEKEAESVFKNSMAISIFMPLIRYYLRQGRSDKVQQLVARVHTLSLKGGTTFLFRELLLEAVRKRDAPKVDQLIADMQRTGMPILSETHLLVLRLCHIRYRESLKTAAPDSTIFSLQSRHDDLLRAQRHWNAYIQSGARPNVDMFRLYALILRLQVNARDLVQSPTLPASSNTQPYRSYQFKHASPMSQIDAIFIAEFSNALSSYLRAGGRLDQGTALLALQFFLDTGHLPGVSGVLALCVHDRIALHPASAALIFDRLLRANALQAACQLFDLSRLAYTSSTTVLPESHTRSPTYTDTSGNMIVKSAFPFRLYSVFSFMRELFKAQDFKRAIVVWNQFLLPHFIEQQQLNSNQTQVPASTSVSEMDQTLMALKAAVHIARPLREMLFALFVHFDQHAHAMVLLWQDLRAQCDLFLQQSQSASQTTMEPISGSQNENIKYVFGATETVSLADARARALKFIQIVDANADPIKSHKIEHLLALLPFQSLKQLSSGSQVLPALTLMGAKNSVFVRKLMFVSLQQRRHAHARFVLELVTHSFERPVSWNTALGNQISNGQQSNHQHPDVTCAACLAMPVNQLLNLCATALDNSQIDILAVNQTKAELFLDFSLQQLQSHAAHYRSVMNCNAGFDKLDIEVGESHDVSVCLPLAHGNQLSKLLDSDLGKYVDERVLFLNLGRRDMFEYMAKFVTVFEHHLRIRIPDEWLAEFLAGYVQVKQHAKAKRILSAMRARGRLVIDDSTNAHVRQRVSMLSMLDFLENTRTMYASTLPAGPLNLDSASGAAKLSVAPRSAPGAIKRSTEQLMSMLDLLGRSQKNQSTLKANAVQVPSQTPSQAASSPIAAVVESIVPVIEVTKPAVEKVAEPIKPIAVSSAHEMDEFLNMISVPVTAPVSPASVTSAPVPSPAFVPVPVISDDKQSTTPAEPPKKSKTSAKPKTTRPKRKSAEIPL